MTHTFSELLNKESYLYPVYETEEPIKDIFEDVVKAFDANMIGPEKYLAMYEQYFYILNGTAEKQLHAFFDTDPFPYLKVSCVEARSQNMKSRFYSRTFQDKFINMKNLKRKLLNCEDQFH